MKIPKQAYTAEFKELAVKRVKDGQSVGMVCEEIRPPVDNSTSRCRTPPHQSRQP